MNDTWNKLRLSALCEVFTDGDWIETKHQSSNGIRLIQTGNIGIGNFKNRKNKARYISNSTLRKLNCTEIFEDDCLVSRLPDPVGKACIIPDINERMITAVDCTIIRFNKNKIIPIYFNYFSQSLTYLSDIDTKTTGATRKRISRKNLGDIIISFPPIPEQKRIVKILDEAFAAIDKAKANAEKNLQNSRELFESYLNKVFANPGEDWEEKKLGEILEIERGGSPRPIQKYLTTDATGINWIKIGDTKEVDKYIFRTHQKIKSEGLRKSRLVKEGDFILSNSMSFGKPYIMKTSGAIHDGWLVLREKKTRVVDKNYLYNILSSPFVFNQFNELAAGSTVRNLNISLVSSVKIHLPPITIQESIVTELDSIGSETKKLESIYQQKLTDLEELKKSILQKAFDGEL